MVYVLKKNVFYLLLLTMLSSFIFMGCTDDSTEKSLINNPPIEDVRDAISSIEHISLIEIVMKKMIQMGILVKMVLIRGPYFFYMTL